MRFNVGEAIETELFCITLSLEKHFLNCKKLADLTICPEKHSASAVFNHLSPLYCRGVKSLKQ